MDKGAGYIYNGILLNCKKETMLFTAIWMDLDIIILSKIGKRTTNTIWYHLHVESKI